MNADHTAAKSHELKRVSPEPGREQTASGQKGAGKKGAAEELPLFRFAGWRAQRYVSGIGPCVDHPTGRRTIRIASISDLMRSV